VRDVVVVVLNLAELLLVSLHQLFYVTILPLLNRHGKVLPPRVQVVPNVLHLLVKVLVHLRALPLKLLPQQGDVPVLLPLQRLQIVVVGELHLLELQLQAALVGLQLELFGAVLILGELQRRFRVCLGSGYFVLLLVEKVLHSLLVNFYFDLVLLLKVLQLALLVAEVGFFVLWGGAGSGG